MAAELDARVRETEAESRERAAILDGMAEAVLALDREFRVRVANPAARLLFGFGEGESPIGEALLRVTRSVELQSAAEACLRGGGPLETELAIYGEAERWFQAFVAPLAAIAGGATGGLVIVLNNITRLRRLERVRKDFVANVSHELRTPIHLIKGFTEALAEGALEDPAQARRFLEIMEGNAARMESLIDDLLTLARLEQEGEAWLQCEVVGVAALLEEAVAAVLPKAEDRGIEIGLSAPADLEARVNAGLLVQAVVNLLDNAVKYSPPGSRVSVAASRTDEEDRFLIEVSDRGMGIPAKDLPRIFERFYRVDKARSKELGGTGLGLAIVRHIALAHEGSVSVESVAGEGSRFALRLPLAGPRAPARPAQV
jgi:two-component system phosphate regulon sensor histidine kinase PhoR